MGQVQNFQIGRNLAVVARTETAFGALPTNPYWVAGDSMKLQSYKFEVKHERKDRMDTRATRSVVEQIEGVIDTSWQCETWLLPRGGTTIPDADPLFLAAMGVGAVAGGDYDYTLSNSQSLPASFAMMMTTASNPIAAEAIVGALCQEMTISAAVGQEPKASFSGVAARHIYTGYGLVNGTVVGGEGTLTLSTTGDRDIFSFENGGAVTIGASGPHYLTDVNFAANSITFLPTVTGAQGVNPIVRPYSSYAEGSTGGSPIPEIRGTATSSSALITMPFGIESFEIKLMNNFSVVRPMFNQRIIDAIPGNRIVEGSMRIWVNQADTNWIGRAKQFLLADVNPIQLSIELGAVGNPGRLAIEMPLVKFDPAGFDVPDAEEAKITLPFKALATTAGDNELVLSWD